MVGVSGDDKALEGKRRCENEKIFAQVVYRRRKAERGVMLIRLIVSRAEARVRAGDLQY